MAWPAHAYAWGDGLAAAQAEMAAFVRLFVAHAGERLHLLCPDGRLPAALAALRADPEAAIAACAVPYGDVWLRDTGPVFLSPGRAVRFDFNGWGDKYRYPHDAALAEALAASLGVPCAPVPMVAEGGALEWDGDGTLITTAACLLNPNRNPQRDRDALTRTLCDALGSRHVIWLDQGLADDHTDGHVDNLARFVGPGRLLCAQADAGDPNHAVLSRIRQQLRGSHTASGTPLTLEVLPTPGRVCDPTGLPLPASYLNFYIANRAVFVPAYGVPADARARAVLAEQFPGREVVGVSARAILAGGGSLHCVTQQVPA